MRFINIFVFFFGILVVLPLANLWAEQFESPESYVKIRLLPQRGVIKPGEEIWIGIEQSIYPGWHTYWKNPGDSGAATTVGWTLPEGFEIGELQWPAPHKLPIGPMLNYGYGDHAILFQKLKAPAIMLDKPVVLIADIGVLVCKEECIPEVGHYELTLNGPEGFYEDNTTYLNAARIKLPPKVEWLAMFEEEQDFLKITIPMTAALENMDPGSARFIPEDWGILNNPDAPVVEIKNGAVILRQKRGERPLDSLDTISGVLSFNIKDQINSFSFTAKKQSFPNAPASEPMSTILIDKSGIKSVSNIKNTSFISAIIFAVFGGIILNLMPCVFPVLSIKALSLIKLSEKSSAHARLHGISYAAGIILSFITIAALLITFKSGGAQIGWGFQLQNPVIVTLLAYLLFIIGLNLSGFFEISGHFGQFGNKLVQGHGLSSSFFTGILATIVATPCTAPFMGLAIGYALLQPPLISLSIFAALGFGLALPYLALSFAPGFQKILPRPGKWMEIFRQFLAFPMFASVAWLIWVLSQQAGDMGVLEALLGMLSIAFGIWLLKHTLKNRIWRYKIRIIAIVFFILAIGLLPSVTINKLSETQSSTAKILEEQFSYQKLESLLQGDYPVFVEMTAAWCITCKVNHAIAIGTEATHRIFVENNVQYLVGDWTNKDDEITRYLSSFRRSGVPLYVYYGPRSLETGQRPPPQILPQILTPGIIENMINGTI